MIWWGIFCVSVFLNIFCVWYIREFLVRFRYHSQISDSLLSVVSQYHDHLEVVYNMEAYYGDGTLENLLRHTKDMRSDIEEYKKIFSLFQGDSLNEPQSEE